mgnify:CR=1 FL=1
MKNNHFSNSIISSLLFISFMTCNFFEGMDFIAGGVGWVGRSASHSDEQSNKSL